MKLKMKCLLGSLRAAISVALVAGAATAMAGSPGNNVAALVGGDLASGDQATLALDASIASAFSYTKPVSGPATATAYFSQHVFCAETPRTPNGLSLRPRYQLPASVGNDVWQFPDVYVQSLAYSGGGAPALRIGEAASAGFKQFRCLSAIPGSSLEPWHVSHGLFDEGYGDYIGAANAALGTPPPRDPPSGPHQNIKVVAESFGGFTGKSVSVVRLEMQFDASVPANTDWTLVDAYNTSALSSLVDAEWCLLRSDWVDGTPPPANLCNDAAILMPGFGPESGPFVRRSVSFTSVAPGPFYVLVSRSTSGTPTVGTPIQGFAALRTGGGMPGVADELQDWFAEDSVWYNY
ncbi:MAG: hypothetical protein KDI72_07280 [Xanthomonadales bacterium]|nr:hypothetical protein [Xanthomonadales bacterium]MCB1573081.1 hypothetical protein [Xanthomonadales bacterium]MCB1579072.1 hypothetical protein [Xanthomonadales bacterium]